MLRSVVPRPSRCRLTEKARRSAARAGTEKRVALRLRGLSSPWTDYNCGQAVSHCGRAVAVWREKSGPFCGEGGHRKASRVAFATLVQPKGGLQLCADVAVCSPMAGPLPSGGESVHRSAARAGVEKRVALRLRGLSGSWADYNCVPMLQSVESHGRAVAVWRESMLFCGEGQAQKSRLCSVAGLIRLMGGLQLCADVEVCSPMAKPLPSDWNAALD